MTNNRTDHDILISVELIAKSLQEDMKIVKDDCKTNGEGLIRQQEQTKTLFSRIGNHERGHKWWGMAIIGIVSLIVTAGLAVVTIIK